jgi:DNA-binding PadR family transcriptional regulator
MRLNATVRAVLSAIDDGFNWGLEVQRVTGLPQRTVYDALARLRRNGWATRELEDTAIALRDGRSERHLYSLTEKAYTERSWREDP